MGIWEAISSSQILYGYAASYDFLIAWSLAFESCVLGIVLLPYWRTRWFGFGFLIAGLFSLVMFYGSMGILLKADKVAWKHEPPPTHFGPDQKATVIVYFKHKVTDEQIEDFNEHILMENAEPRHDGMDYPDFFAMYLRLLPDQANGFEAVALTFREDAPKDRVEKYLLKIKGDSRVEKIVLNAVPLEVNKTKNQ